jgi:hypothetical protein
MNLEDIISDPRLQSLARDLDKYLALTEEERERLENEPLPSPPIPPTPKQIQARLDWRANVPMPWPKQEVFESRAISPFHELMSKGCCSGKITHTRPKWTDEWYDVGMRD